MSARTRLWLLFFLVVISAGYAVLIKKDPNLANSIASLYVAFLLTLLTVNHVWRHRGGE
jgi:hypothetical protein